MTEVVIPDVPRMRVSMPPVYPARRRSELGSAISRAGDGAGVLTEPRKRRGRRALEGHALAARVREAEPGGVQTQSAQRIARSAVGAIADDGVAERGELDADLTAPSRDERQLEQRRPRAPRAHPVLGDRLAPRGP